MAAQVTYQTRTDEAANLWLPAEQAPAVEVVHDQADTAQDEEWGPDETGDAIDFLASIDSHTLGHDDAWETGL
jgi:hypothetical protein